MKPIKITGHILKAAVYIAKAAVSLHVLALNQEVRAANRKLDRELNKLVSMNQALSVQRRRYLDVRGALVDTRDRVNVEINEAKSRVL